MRIALNGRFYGVPVWGVQRFAREVAARLPARADVTLLLPAGVEPPGGRKGPEGEPGRIRRGRLRGHLWEHVELPWAAARAGCDVVLNLGGTAPLRSGPHVTAIHDVLPLTNPAWFGPAFALWSRVVVRRAALRSAALLVPSRWARAELLRVLEVEPGRVHVVGQGTAPFDGPVPPAEVRRVRERFGLPETFALAVGAGDRRKNVPFLERTWSRWRKAEGGSVPPLVVVGARRRRVHGLGPPAAGRGASPGAAEGLRDRRAVRRLGYVDDRDLHALYTGAAVFCFPSLAEGFGRPPLEAMACETPAVVAPYGCAPEVLGDGALMVPLDSDAWIGAISGLLADREARTRRVEAGLRRAGEWSWESAADAVVWACHSAVGRVGDRARAPSGRPA